DGPTNHQHIPRSHRCRPSRLSVTPHKRTIIGVPPGGFHQPPKSTNSGPRPAEKTNKTRPDPLRIAPNESDYYGYVGCYPDDANSEASRDGLVTPPGFFNELMEKTESPGVKPKEILLDNLPTAVRKALAAMKQSIVNECGKKGTCCTSMAVIIEC